MAFLALITFAKISRFIFQILRMLMLLQHETKNLQSWVRSDVTTDALARGGSCVFVCIMSFPHEA